MEKIKVGILGAGGMGRVHAFFYTQNDSCELLAICEKDKNLLAKMQSGDWPKVDYGDELASFDNAATIPRGYTNLDELCNDKDVDAVSVCLPNSLHASSTIKLLKAGKHVLVEKPMAGTAKECEEMIKIAKEKNLVLQVGHMWRFHSDVQMVKQVLQSGLIGDIVKIKGYGIHVNWAPDGWFIDPNLAIGGSLIDMGVHAIDTISYCIGDSQPKSVYSTVETRYGDYKVDDITVVMVKYENGATGIIESGWGNPYADGGEAACRFYGTKGYASVFPTEVHYELGGKWGKFVPDRVPGEMTLDQEGVECYKRQINNFVNAVLGKEKSLAPGEVGLKVMQVVDGAYRSAKEQTVIKF